MKFIRKLRKAAEAEGWRVRNTRNGHFQFLSPDKSVDPIVVSSTPSDYRAMKKIQAMFKRNGLDVAI